jgi:hypothetical protein
VTVNVTIAPDTAFPFASITFTLGGVGKVEPADVVWLLPAFTAICVAAPAVNVIVLLPLVMAAASIVAEIVVPPTIGELIVAEYVPLLLSVVLDSVPVPDLEMTTVPRENVRFVPPASLSWTVIWTALPAVTEADETEIVDCTVDAATVVTFALLPVTPPVVADSTCVTGVVGVPAVVKLIVAVPDAFVTDVGAEKLPPLVLPHVTVWLASATALLLASRNCAATATRLAGAGFVAAGVTR